VTSLETTWTKWRVDLIGAAVLVVLTSVFVLGPVRGGLRQRAVAKVQRTELAAQESRLAQADRILMAVKKDYGAVEARLAQSALHLEPSANVNSRLARISELAIEAGLQIDEIKPGAPLMGEHYETVPIFLAGNGTYRQCAVFLHQLRQALPDTGAESLELSGNAAAPAATGTFRFNLHWHAAPPTQTAMK